MLPKNTLSSIILILISHFVLAQTHEGKIVNKEVTSTPLAFVQQHKLISKFLEQEVAIDIYLPESYNKDCNLHTYPLIVLLENEFFYQITGIAKHLSSVSSMPESIVISFPDGFEKFYAPKIYTNNSNFWPKSWTQMPFDGAPGKFVDFFKEELFNYLETQYRIADYRIIVGTSPTSTFPLHAFCKEPNLFQGHIAIAAGDIIGMGYTPNETFIDAIIDAVKRNPGTRAHLYVTSADEDSDYDTVIGKNLEELQRQMQAFTSNHLKLKAEVFPNESHYGVVIPAFISAMETFFPKKKWNRDFRDFEKQPGNTLDNIDQYYLKLSTEYGYAVLPKAERWNSGNSLRASANRLLRQKRFEESIEVYKRLVEYRPKSAEALSTLASALEYNKNLKEAFVVQKKAIELAKKYDKEHLEYYTEHMEEIASKIEDSKE
ncbi:alpha/beta hydrolase-fold protein [Aquimarina gracilis]|uniref:Alpha/beta hydrolase-fold protein n=1 Tax=Aquimarina gracilis TaxID=874422 RepID=A0ABU5ZWD4_9FLAO|nr:alpha/beta hydrolase-fold protein [Aquimarina gracilis]MEB3346187.1 alpha/beta hydrolase-fold protein [Aquimarina gracilis]